MSDHSLARTIWRTSRADEGTISATGANHVATAVLELLASDRMREAVAEAIYLQSPARTPWGGDDMAFDEPHWAARDKTESARQKATAALAAIRTELEGTSDE